MPAFKTSSTNAGDIARKNEFEWKTKKHEYEVCKVSVIDSWLFSDPKVLCFTQQCNTKEIYGTE